jgi:nitrate reductase cytochrome c-type subunit
MEKICKNCKKQQKISNAFFGLCLICNNNRLQSNRGVKKNEATKYIQKDKKLSSAAENRLKFEFKESLRRKTNEKKRNSAIIEDEKFYEQSFNLSNHKCEECNKQLPTDFRGEDGKVIARWRYSHVIPKSIAPELRHNLLNINNLCLQCHQEWENGNKFKMNIFNNNYTNFSNYLNAVKIKGLS